METKYYDLFGGSNKLLWIVRFFLLAFSISIATDALFFGLESDKQFWIGVWAAVASLAICIGTIFLDMSSNDKDITTLSAISFGLMGGLVVSSLFWFALEPIVKIYLGNENDRIQKTVQLLLTVVVCSSFFNYVVLKQLRKAHA